MRTGLHLDDRNPAAFYKDHPGYGSNNATVGVGPGGIATAGSRQRCHMETTTTERHDGRRITYRERAATSGWAGGEPSAVTRYF
jgi:hypothetical protein